MYHSVLIALVATLTACGSGTGGIEDSFYIRQIPGARIVVDGIESEITRPGCAHNESELHQCGVVTKSSDQSIDSMLSFTIDKSFGEGAVIVKKHEKENPDKCEEEASLQFVNFIEDEAFDDCHVGGELELRLERVTEQYLQVSLSGVLMPSIESSDKSPVSVMAKNIRVGLHVVEQE